MCATASLAAVYVATVRDRAEIGAALDLAVANALAESPTLAEATPRLLDGIGDLLGWQAGVVVAVISAFMIWRHKVNIQRLLAGTEPRIGAKKATPSGPSAA